jgi:hypothetical protein
MRGASLMAKEKAPPKRGFMIGYRDNAEGGTAGYASDQQLSLYRTVITSSNYK